MIDKQSETWEELVKIIDAEMADTQKRLLSKSSDMNDTQFNRGYYAALAKIKAWPDKPQVTPIESDNYF